MDRCRVTGVKKMCWFVSSCVVNLFKCTVECKFGFFSLKFNMSFSLTQKLPKLTKYCQNDDKNSDKILTKIPFWQNAVKKILTKYWQNEILTKYWQKNLTKFHFDKYLTKILSIFCQKISKHKLSYIWHFCPKMSVYCQNMQTVSILSEILTEF